MYQANKDGCTILFDNKRTPAVALTSIPEIICRSSFNVTVPSISPSAKLALLEMVGKLSTVIALGGENILFIFLAVQDSSIGDLVTH